MTDSLRKLECYDHGRWFMLPLDFLKILPAREAVFLAYLINLVCMRLANGQGDEEDWVCITTRDLSKCALSEDQIKRSLRSLRRHKLVRTQSRGRSRKRWLWIDGTLLQTAIEVGSVKGAKVHPSLGAKVHPSKGAEVHPCIKSSSRSFLKEEHCLACRETEWSSLGSMLKDSINNHVRSISSTSTPYKWGEHFRRLHTTDKVAPDRIEEVLQWYCNTLKVEGDIIGNGNPNYIPVAMSGAAFRKKFEQLEAAMQRTRKATKRPRKLRVEVADDHDPDDPNYYGDD